MEFSRCTLKKDGKKVILQGLIHGLPKLFLKWLKRDLKSHIKNGYRVFYEGVLYDERTKFSKRERSIIKCLEILEDIQREVILSLNLKSIFATNEDEEDAIEYPRNAINIDISFAEYVRLLTEKGLECKQFLDLMKEITSQKYRDSVVKTTQSLLNGTSTLEQLQKKAEEIPFFRISDSIKLDYRSQVAANKIEEYSNKKGFKKIFVHYGEAHIEQIVKLLEAKGWELVKSVKIDSHNPEIKHRRRKGVPFLFFERSLIFGLKYAIIYKYYD